MALHFPLDNTIIRFSPKLYRRIAYCMYSKEHYFNPLAAVLFLFCFGCDFMLSLPDNNQAGVIDAFNSKSRYTGDLPIIDNPYFVKMVCQIYPLNFSQINNFF